jgi:DNA polymerase iota
MSHYYSDLSDDDSADPEVSDNDEHDDDGDINNCYTDVQQQRKQGTTSTASTSRTDDLWGRVIVHLDVDCFYCQCEEIDGPPSYRQRPLAIGQKHIIVTSNYVARQHGVKKLQSRDAAYIACPNLLILEGSDLHTYRTHSRKIYLAFRESLKALADHQQSTQAVTVQVQVRKGGMDECFADITELVRNTHRMLPPDTFVYGDDASIQSTIVEDQSGATSVAQYHPSTTTSNDNVHETYSSNRHTCQERLHTAAALCAQVRAHIRDTTGFTTTMGISVNKMLSKLASDLKKPNSVNVLYPWRSSSILLSMPLRKIPDLGRSTLHLLKECLLKYHGIEPKFWTCQ